MKIYKNYLKKFVQAYVSQKPNTHCKDLTMFSLAERTSSHSSNAGLNVSTPLPDSLLQHVLNWLLALSAVVLLYQLSMPSAYVISFSFFIIFLVVLDTIKFRKRRMDFHSLHCIDHVWFIQTANDTYEKLELQSISKGLGMFYLLHFKNTESASLKSVCIWRYQTGAEFLAYCSQLLLLGKK